MAEERKYVTVNGKKIPLKTESERAASKPQQSTETSQSSSNNGGVSVGVPAKSSARTVLLSLSVALGIFLLAGGKIEKVIAKARGETTPASDQPFTANTLAAWAALFVGLMVMADFPATGDLAAALALLILFSVLLEFGPTAFDNLNINAPSQPIRSTDPRRLNFREGV